MSNEVEREQAYVSMLYDHLDRSREQAVGRLTEALALTSTSHQTRSQRDGTVAMYADRVARYDAVDNGLCFGRLDRRDGGRHHIGRIGIHDVTTDADPLLMDWRAPAARPFYLATVAAPDGVTRRRQIRTRGRTVLAVEDEILDGEVPSEAGPVTEAGLPTLTNESALLAAMTANRTGRMADIVETIQAEQDRVIRSDHAGVLVVSGGPGTGKTAVALHRAAYLLYTYRAELSRRGVLIVGPNPTFLRYIGQVLPGLGESAVVLSTIGDLLPGLSADATEPARVAAIKGSPAMTGVVEAAVRDRQRVPAEPWEIRFDGDTLLFDRRMGEEARDRARGSGLRHNAAREVFLDAALDALTAQIIERIGADVLGGANLLTGADIATIRTELSHDREVVGTLSELWPILTPRQLLTDLYTDRDRLDTAAAVLDDSDRAALYRADSTGWTPADVPLLDEAAELLGDDDRDTIAAADRERRREVAYAEGVLEIMSRDIEDDLEILMAHDLVDARRLAGRQTDAEWMSVADQAAADRGWMYGHVIVDEAQELSAMAWRMLMRRCPSRSMTLVGDVAQTGDLAGTSSWDATLSPYVADRWRLSELTVNYRTPAEIMAVAADVLVAIDPGLRVPVSLREAGTRPWRLRVEAGELTKRLDEIVADEIALLGDGRLAVLVPGDTPDADLGARVVRLSVRQAKGLEFDSVVVVEPDRIIAESPRGLNDLYVALTRATQRLGVVHVAEIPRVLATLTIR